MLLFLSLLEALGNKLGILGGGTLRRLDALALESEAVSLALQDDGSDETLDSGRLECGLLALLLCRDFATDDVLADIVILAEIEELSDLAGTLRAKSARNGNVGEAGQLLLAILHNDDRQNCKIGADDAAADRLALALACAARAVARVSLGKQKADSVVEEDSLLHREALLVISAGNLEDVPLKLVAKGIDLDLLRNALVVEDAQLALVGDLDELLAAGGRICNVELRKGEVERACMDGWILTARDNTVPSFATLVF